MDIRKDDQVAVLGAVGPLILAILREGVEQGFHAFTVSRNKDVDAFTEYTDCTKMNMLYDRIATSVRQLVDAASADGLDAWWKITSNKRATDVFLGTWFAFRIKRSKRNRNGCTTGVLTKRQRAIKSAVMPVPGQSVLPFPHMPAIVPDEERIWLTVGFDLDDIEESLTPLSIGFEARRRFLWREMLPVGDTGVIGTICPLLADMMADMRRGRTA